MTPGHPPPTPQALWQQAAATPPQIVVITGEINAGKTTWCAQMVAYARAQGLIVAGLLSVGVFDDGDRKSAIDLHNLADGSIRRLAKRRPTPDANSPTPNWDFDAAALAWGNVNLAAISLCDLLVIDELGPLELKHGQGWVNALPMLDQGDYQVACVVVRLGLLPVFLARYPQAITLHIPSPDAP